MGLRDAMKEKPWIAWTICGVCLATGGLMLVNSKTQSPPDSVQRLSEDVTIRCTETGEEWTMNRGRFEEMLLFADGQIDPAKGVPSKFGIGFDSNFITSQKFI